MNAKRILPGGLLAGSVIVIGETVRQAIFTDAIPASGGSMPFATRRRDGARSLGTRPDARGNLEAELLDGARVPVSRARAQELRSLGR